MFTAAWTYDPAPLANDLTGLRYALLKQGHDLPCFHAAEDMQLTRDAVVTRLVGHEGWNFAAVVVEKAKVFPPLREELRFYPKFAGMVLSFVFRSRVRTGTSKILIYTDTIPLQRQRKAAEKAIKTWCRSECRGIPFECYHHRRESNAWLQVVDYCSWGIFRKWEGGDDRTYAPLSCRLAAPELNVLAAGTTLHY